MPSPSSVAFLRLILADINYYRIVIKGLIIKGLIIIIIIIIIITIIIMMMIIIIKGFGG